VNEATANTTPCGSRTASMSVATLGIDERTIRRAYSNPASVRESTLRRIERGAQELGLAPPRVSRETSRDTRTTPAAQSGDR
jgi:DNA-binding LacI/PurR family transcriptional regulator